MKKIKIFLASSNELKEDRDQFEIEIYRKCKKWVDKGIFLHLDIWEDLSARMSNTRSQDDYNQKIKEADLFVLLAYSKVGMYTAEEFETAFGAFQETKKPFIYIYFKEIHKYAADIIEPSLQEFKNKLGELCHFPVNYSKFSDLWLEFNKELERLEETDFAKHVRLEKKDGSRVINQGDKSAYIEKPKGDVNINFS
ncbi:MAG: hypothetical protein ABUK01_16065 [Leptospirales bacterium]